MSPAHLHSLLLRCEIDGDLAPDCRRILSDERQVLGLRIAAGDEERIAAACAESIRVLRLWGIEVGA